MDSFELNKILGAVLFTCMVVLGMSIISEYVFYAPHPEQSGYVIDVPEDGTAVAEEEDATPLPVLLAAADASAGEAAVRPCVACHTFEEGGETRVGPNLYNTIGNVKGHDPNFNYSSAMQERQDAGETWGYEEMDAFLANPRGYLPGTTMSFAGVRDEEARADIVVYLASLSSDAPPLPEVEDEPAADEDADAPADAADETDAPGDAAEGEADNGEPPAGPADAGVPADEVPAGDDAAPADGEEAAPAEDDAAPADEEEAAPAETGDEPAADEEEEAE